MHSIKTLGALKASGYTSKSIKNELRGNLVKALRNKEKIFKGILGFDDTVLPDMERALLSRHNILLLGLRGQAKTRIARQMVHLLDEFIPAVEGSEINDDPLNPLSKFARNLVAEQGDDTPIHWIHREERFVEKLATPDVSVADLIGDVDPIKAATLKLPYSDERVIHFGLVPHANRSIFVLNELPDLQARIQVSLFNILQEGDIQIRGFKLRLPLDIQFVFTANPEDYTNRGSIITPLKDRIESQILTHYPVSVEIAKQITLQEAKLAKEQLECIKMPEILHHLLEQTAFEARKSELVDEKSGVSARLTISGYENLVSSAERRLLRNKEKKTSVRIADFVGFVPAITGKVELVYEGEQEGPYGVALHLIGKALKEVFLLHFPNPDKLPKRNARDPFQDIRDWFAKGNTLDLTNDATESEFKQHLDQVPGLRKLVEATLNIKGADSLPFMELVLHGLAEFNVIQKEITGNGLSFNDVLADMLGDNGEEEEDY